MAAFLVRVAREADHEALIANTVALNRFENEITGDRVTELSSAEAVLAYFKRRTGNGGLMLVAEAEGRVIGHLFLAVEEAAPFLASEYRRENLQSATPSSKKRRGARASSAPCSKLLRRMRGRRAPGGFI